MACAGTDSPCVIAGDDWNYNLLYTESDETIPIDLTGATVLLQFRDSVTDVAIVETASGGIINAALGQMLFTLTDVQTAALLPRAQESRNLVFSVKVTFSDLTEQTILTGVFSLEQAATE